jgi:hypothetical protein
MEKANIPRWTWEQEIGQIELDTVELRELETKIDRPYA